MTQEEKAKAYDEAIERAKKHCADYVVETIFPELKESEDEKIRKAIIEFFELQDDNTTYSFIPKKDILRYLVGYQRENRMNLFGYISDQAPKWENIHLWIPFLGHETPVFTGAERIMRKMRNAVFYVDMERPRRGHYVVTARLITTDPASMPEHEITRQFFSMLEETIRREPSCYLWSHDRWRRTHEEFNRRYEVVNGKVIQRKES